jgi:hypothetical protein
MAGRQLKDLTGKVFGRLLVTDKYRRRNYQRGRGGSELQRLCICECGNKIHVLTAKLLNDTVKSCGCHIVDFKIEQSKMAAKNRILRGYIASSEARGYDWNLSDNDFDCLIFQNCYYCGIPPLTPKKTCGKHSVEIFYNGIDRIDNNLGYTKDNCVACCKICNRAKSDLDIKEFMLWIKRIKQQ